MVYILNQSNEALMPTEDHRMVRLLLKENKAKVVKRTPFTIKLLIETKEYKQDITLGVDAGSKMIGISATTEDKELLSAEYELRNDIVKKIATRRQYRRSRRNRLRYREARFNNRGNKQKGWLAPSVEHKADSHLRIIKDLHKTLPITRVVIETASFDTQLLKNPEIEGRGYQQGPLINHWNVREYVLFRDNHTCQHCKGKSKDKVLEVHHIESRKTGGNSPENLITLCSTCHKAHHLGKISLKVKRGDSFRDAAFMGIMRWSVYEKLKNKYGDVQMTFGYITKHNRIANSIEKSHINDAYCIAGNFRAKRNIESFYFKKVRCHNRQLHKANFLKGHKKKANQAPKYVKGYQLFDKVLAEGEEWFIFGRRATGYFDLRKLDGRKLNKGSYSCKRIKLITNSNNLLIERRMAIPPATEEAGILAKTS